MLNFDLLEDHIICICLGKPSKKKKKNNRPTAVSWSFSRDPDFSGKCGDSVIVKSLMSNDLLFEVEPCVYPFLHTMSMFIGRVNTINRGELRCTAGRRSSRDTIAMIITVKSAVFTTLTAPLHVYV